MRNRYSVLRSVRGAHTREPFSGGRAELEAFPMATRPEPRVETADLTPGNLRDLARDPEVTAIAPVMPTKLITPMGADRHEHGRPSRGGRGRAAVARADPGANADQRPDRRRQAPRQRQGGPARRGCVDVADRGVGLVMAP
jgi:hypothetical protein